MVDVNKMADDLKPKDPEKAQAEIAEKKILAGKEKVLSPVSEAPAEPPAPPAPPTSSKLDEPKEYHVYHCARETMHMHTPSGRDIRFHDKRCVTDNEEVIEYLDSEIAAGNRFITVNKDQPTVTSDDLDPMAVIRRNIIKEYLAEQQAEAAANAPRDMGSYDNQNGIQPRVKIPSTADIAALSGDSNSASK